MNLENIAQEMICLEELIEQCDEAIAAWNDDCKACGFGPGIVKDLALDKIQLLQARPQ